MPRARKTLQESCGMRRAARLSARLERELRLATAPQVSILRHAWPQAVADLVNHVEKYVDCTPIGASAGLQARINADAIWTIMWCASAISTMLGPTPPPGVLLTRSDNTIEAMRSHHGCALLLANMLADGAARAIAPAGVQTNARILLDMIKPALGLYELCKSTTGDVPEQFLLQAAAQAPVCGTQVDCLLMVPPVLLPNLGESIWRLTEDLMALTPKATELKSA